MAEMKIAVVFLGVFTLASSEWIDLSHVFDNTTISWGDSTRFQHTIVHKGKISNEIPYYSAFDIMTAEHSGTHLDAPIHFAEGKWSVDQIPPEKLVGQAIVISISTKALNDHNAQLTVADLQNWEKTHGRIPNDSILLVLTGWGKYWPNYKEYMGTSTRNTSLYRFPGKILTSAVAINKIGLLNEFKEAFETNNFDTHWSIQVYSYNGVFSNVLNCE